MGQRTSSPGSKEKSVVECGWWAERMKTLDHGGRMTKKSKELEAAAPLPSGRFVLLVASPVHE